MSTQLGKYGRFSTNEKGLQPMKTQHLPPEMRKAFDGLNMTSTPITYSVGGNGKSKPTSELIVRNW
jgi:hypothetical protein